MSRSRKSNYNVMSTTALAKHFDIPSQSLFNFLTEKSWIEKIYKNWRLTGKGEFEAVSTFKVKNLVSISVTKNIMNTLFFRVTRDPSMSKPWANDSILAVIASMHYWRSWA